MTENDQPKPPDTEGQAERKKVKCETCGRLVEVEEITTARGKFYCPDCVDGAIAMESILPFREKYDNRAIRWTVLGCGILLLAVVLGSTLLLILTYMRLDTEIECKARMGRLYQKMVAYAGDADYNAYPPENNDLRPLYTSEYTTTFSLFICPGTKNVVTAVRHLNDESAAPEGEGMSFFYQGGYSFVNEEGDRKRPLFWDQSPANHKGRGVNILFKDGHHDWTERPPELRPPEEVGVGAARR